MTTLIEDHRAIEGALDRLAETIGPGTIDAGLLRRAADSMSRHFLREEAFLGRLHLHDPALAGKLRAQHEEALEIAARLEESLLAGHAGDVGYLARRFLAIARHNMIEEERDVFPLAGRF